MSQKKRDWILSMIVFILVMLLFLFVSTMAESQECLCDDQKREPIEDKIIEIGIAVGIATGFINWQRNRKYKDGTE